MQTWRDAELSMLGPMQFHLLAFEGPDAYARAGGVATRVSGLAQALTEADFDTHLWFIGDPALPGHETQGSLHRHRWCQWSSPDHPAGVYAGEEGKRWDDARSLPPFLLRERLRSSWPWSWRPRTHRNFSACSRPCERIRPRNAPCGGPGRRASVPIPKTWQMARFLTRC